MKITNENIEETEITFKAHHSAEGPKLFSGEPEFILLCVANICNMRPDYPTKLFNDNSDSYTCLMNALAEN